MTDLRWLVLIVSGILTACASSPTQQADRFAARAGIVSQIQSGTYFDHKIYSRIPAGMTSMLHVYIEGDGTPWIRNNLAARDPTPRNPLALRLMAQDSDAVLYLGRPCYFGLAMHAPCTPIDWTHGRYSEQVVNSMAAVLQNQLTALAEPEIVFIGYSGGGNLAMLLAPRFDRTQAVITLAGNLDHRAWTRLHDYTPLDGSLSAADLPTFPDRVHQYHFAGAEDENIPPDLIRTALSKQPQARLKVLPSIDHNCCWDKLWLGILDEI